MRVMIAYLVEVLTMPYTYVCSQIQTIKTQTNEHFNAIKYGSLHTYMLISKMFICKNPISVLFGIGACEMWHGTLLYRSNKAVNR